MRITRISKASWFKIKANDIVIYFDPGYTGYFENQDIPIEELNDKADYIFISHFHKDHLQPRAVELISKSNSKIYAPKSFLEGLNRNITIVKPNEEFQDSGITINTVDAYNTPEGHSTRKVHHKGAFVGYVININGTKIYHAGDTDVIPEMRELGAIDIAFLPIGGTFVMDVSEAVKATKIINPKIVIPMHEAKQSLDTFKLNLNDFKSTNVVCLNVGEVIEL